MSEWPVVSRGQTVNVEVASTSAGILGPLVHIDNLGNCKPSLSLVPVYHGCNFHSVISAVQGGRTS